MKTKRITKRDLVSEIYDEIGYKANDNELSDEEFRILEKLYNLNKPDIYYMINMIENIVYDNLKKANKDESIVIALFKGMNIEGSYVPSKSKVSNLTGETIVTSSKIKPKANFSRPCCEMLSEELD